MTMKITFSGLKLLSGKRIDTLGEATPLKLKKWIPDGARPMTFKEWLQEETRKTRAASDDILASMPKEPKGPKIKSTEEQWRELTNDPSRDQE
jgi:hypothetical protein